MSNEDVVRQDTTTVPSSSIENRIENRIGNDKGESSGSTPSKSRVNGRTTQDSIRNSIRTSNRTVKGSCSLYMDLTLRQELERIAEQEKTSFSSLVSAICDSYLRAVKPQPKSEPQPKEPASEPSSESPTPDTYLENVKREWPDRPQEWREKTARYIAKQYGPAGQEFLQSLATYTDPARISPEKPAISVIQGDKP